MNILGLNKEHIKALDTFSSAFIINELNITPTLHFRVNRELGKYFKEEYYVQVEGYGEFIIKEKKSSSNKYEIVAKANIEDFYKDFYPNYTYTTRTLKSIIDPLINPLGWKFECSDTKKKTLTGKDKNTLEILLHGLEVFEYEYTWDLLSKTIKAAPKIGEDKGSYIHQELNLRQINITTQSYDFVTRLIPKGKDDLGIESINGGIPYLEPTNKYSNKVIYGVWRDERFTVVENLKAAAQKRIDSLGNIYKSYEVDILDLASLNKKYNYLEFNVGDVITLVDKENESYSKERIVTKKEYLKDKLKNSVVLSNTPLTSAQIRMQNEENLQNQIEINRQYITVLEKEIKTKVSSEIYNDLEKRLSVAEEIITPDSITSMVSSEVEIKLSDSTIRDQFVSAETGVRILENISSVTQTADEIVTRFESYTANNDVKIEGIDKTVTRFSTIISEGQHGINVSKEGSEFNINIDNDSLDIRNGENVVAYASEDRFYGDRIEILEELIFHNVKFIKRDSGNISLIKMNR